MFYLLTVYSTGATLMIQGDDLKAINLMAEQSLGNDGVTYIQTGALPFGPVFSTELAEPTLFPMGPESPVVEVEGDAVMMIDLPKGVYYSPKLNDFGIAQNVGLRTVFTPTGSPEEFNVWKLHKHLFPVWPQDQQNEINKAFSVTYHSAKPMSVFDNEGRN